VSCLKPLDAETLIKSASKTGHVITIEEHNVIGGLGSAVSECLMQKHPVQMEMIGIQDTFAETGPYDELLEKYGISVGNVMNKVNNLLKIKA
jgi:transketolase